MITAVYPGTFDPITIGHEDLIKRASCLFDQVFIAIACNKKKQPLFTIKERIEMAEKILAKYKNVSIYSFDGLLKDFVEKHKAKIIIRGIRTYSDFEYECKMANINKQLINNVETVFLTSSDQFKFISSTAVKEIAYLGGDISKFVFPTVEKYFQKKSVH
ncbi:pantetheine-phosphate adenylyltransferase [Candidatus Kinetoplastidibacterium crithidiae]|uniref:Phosphopantetheine adenylyltransferase n=1 Tax=Candidatus Kinetoplastidibacterium crithidiae TCC036E TaxID=1208918 RepID=M1M5F4_9PROT|nr:pantetheine-phosphate adenylyltransferase [Candidatus Kinetoplastibacterium crithidii]AFZ83124.1 pantetheine-phosphate adenylyltransferase [Candidatus Kinetoplastibacterium crithidii (ex Angomonas deanei ATCC 30255)]AGF47400.1 pantetheine-phosphate adenylyltransferase [Candidatus Kinetoplastibacterium crithidii TCC036E]